MQGLKIHTWRRIVFPTTTASYRKYCDGSWTGLKQAAFCGPRRWLRAHGDPMILLVWESMEASVRWSYGPRYRTLFDGMRPHLSGDFVITFFNLEGGGFNYRYPNLIRCISRLRKSTGTEKEGQPMIVQMLIAEMRDRYALAECLETYTEKIGPLLANVQGLQAAYLAGEEGESLLAIVTLIWTSREAAMAWLNGGGRKALVGTVGSYSRGGIIFKFFRV